MNLEQKHDMKKSIASWYGCNLFALNKQTSVTDAEVLGWTIDPNHYSDDDMLLSSYTVLQWIWQLTLEKQFHTNINVNAAAY